MTGQAREKSLRLVVTFPTTTAAMAMEQLCGREAAPGRIIPVPRSISASCGLAWCAPPACRETLERLARDRSVPVEGWYYVML